MENARQLEQEETESVGMVQLMDVLQCLGVGTETACGFASAIARNKPRFQKLQTALEMTSQRVSSVTDARP